MPAFAAYTNVARRVSAPWTPDLPLQSRQPCCVFRLFTLRFFECKFLSRTDYTYFLNADDADNTDLHRFFSHSPDSYREHRIRTDCNPYLQTPTHDARLMQRLANRKNAGLQKRRTTLLGQLCKTGTSQHHNMKSRVGRDMNSCRLQVR